MIPPFENVRQYCLQIAIKLRPVARIFYGEVWSIAEMDQTMPEVLVSGLGGITLLETAFRTFWKTLLYFKLLIFKSNFFKTEYFIFQFLEWKCGMLKKKKGRKKVGNLYYLLGLMRDVCIMIFQ